jgi:hypothetical protein
LRFVRPTGSVTCNLVRISRATSAFAVIHTKTLLEPCCPWDFRHFVVLFLFLSCRGPGTQAPYRGLRRGGDNDEAGATGIHFAQSPKYLSVGISVLYTELLIYA